MLSTMRSRGKPHIIHSLFIPFYLWAKLDRNDIFSACGCAHKMESIESSIKCNKIYYKHIHYKYTSVLVNPKGNYKNCNNLKLHLN